MPCTNNLLGQAKLKRGQMPKDCNKQTTTKQLQAQYVRHGTKFEGHTQEGATPKRPTMYHIHILTYIYIYHSIYISKQNTSPIRNANEIETALKHHCICSNTLFTWGIAKVQIVICWSNQMSLTTFKMPTHVGHKNLSRNILVKEQTSVPTSNQFVRQQNACYHSLLLSDWQSQIIQQAS